MTFLDNTFSEGYYALSIYFNVFILFSWRKHNLKFCLAWHKYILEFQLRSQTRHENVAPSEVIITQGLKYEPVLKDMLCLRNNQEFKRFCCLSLWNIYNCHCWLGGKTQLCFLCLHSLFKDTCHTGLESILCIIINHTKFEELSNIWWKHILQCYRFQHPCVLQIRQRSLKLLSTMKVWHSVETFLVCF